MSDKLVLSLFPGIGLLDMAFEELGFCVVRGPDLLWGGDIKRFNPPPDVFYGVIGGPPCQEFSGLRRIAPTGYGVAMLRQFARCVTQANPEWWLLENVARTPNVFEICDLAGYVTQRFDVNQGWYCDTSRLRHIQFGSKSGRLLNVTPRTMKDIKQGAALANDSRDFKTLCRIQGLPDGFDLPGFLVREKVRAVGNGVPLVMGRILAKAVIDAYSIGHVTQRLCADGCGRPVTGKALYASATCRKRAQRKRDRTRSGHGSGVTYVTDQAKG